MQKGAEPYGFVFVNAGESFSRLAAILGLRKLNLANLVAASLLE